VTLYCTGNRFLFALSSPVRLAYDSIDANSDGEDLPPLVILHGLFGSKTNWRTLAKRFHRDTGRQVMFTLLESLTWLLRERGEEGGVPTTYIT